MVLAVVGRGDEPAGVEDAVDAARGAVDVQQMGGVEAAVENEGGAVGSGEVDGDKDGKEELEKGVGRPCVEGVFRRRVSVRVVHAVRRRVARVGQHMYSRLQQIRKYGGGHGGGHGEGHGGRPVVDRGRQTPGGPRHGHTRKGQGETGPVDAAPTAEEVGVEKKHSDEPVEHLFLFLKKKSKWTEASCRPEECQSTSSRCCVTTNATTSITKPL